MDMAGWRSYKNAQWAEIQKLLAADPLANVSWSQHGPGGDTFIIGIDHAAFGEQRIIVGRPAVMKARTFAGQNGYEDEEVVDGGENVSLSEMKDIVETWRAGKRWAPKDPVRK